MSDLIERQAAIDALRREYNTEDSDYPTEYQLGLSAGRRIIDELPSAQFIEPERKTGKWDFIGDNMFACSGCGTPYTLRQLSNLKVRTADSDFPKFCPNCGTDMRGGRGSAYTKD